MKKILLAVDPTHLNTSTLAFGSFLSRLTRSKITGVFLENLEADKKPVISNAYDGTYFQYEAKEDSEAYQTKLKLIKDKIRQFKDYYENHGVVCSVHEDKGVPVAEIIEETRYADLMIVDAETNFEEKAESIPTSFVKRMLAEAECPVVIAPFDFDGVEEIVFAYNGSKSCMYAIKEFADLFPQLEDKRLTVVEVNQFPGSASIDLDKFKEWLQTRYSNVHFKSLTGQTDTELLGYLLEKRKIFIVMGAFGRSAVSTFFKRSAANILLKVITQPIFIAHH